ncbi:MAG: transporter substrate-binding domain-containing protein [Desulfobacterales bacterium]|nr:transporter substrate-binding domain-containing protein [Desulfobacterales bacterium]MCP4162150.1 transporter substrate-binding domain-containing protein [Deltaproteobacteria bacterium]
MKRFAISCLILMCLNSIKANDITIDIGDWEPFTSSRVKNANITEKLVIEAFKLVKIKVNFKYYPWKRSLVNVKKGESVATFPWMKSKERDKQFYYSEQPVLKEKTVFFHLKYSGFKWNNYNDLKKYRIGGTIGYLQAEDLQKRGIKVQMVGIEDLNYKKILAGRIDAYPTSYFVGYYQINMLYGKQKASLFTHHPKPVMTSDYYMLFSKKIPNIKGIIEKFNDGLKKLKKSGRYDELIKIKR